MGRPVHFELGVQDPQPAANFYSKIFSWKTEEWPGSVEYWLITTGEKDATVNVLDVEDIDDALQEIDADGGSIDRFG
jgi:predicted enzyme related to lactoylglutathione lyase